MNNTTNITLVDHMGNDLSVVNAARVSFGSKKNVLDDKDIKLIKYLAEHKHMSPFRHVQFSFRLENICEAVARQFYKHQVGCGYTGGEFRESATVWNEISGRYVELENNFYIPAEFRVQSENNKQASVAGSNVKENEYVSKMYKEILNKSYETYKKLLEAGVCKEQARLVLPLAFQTSFYWTASLEAVAHFIKLRDHEGAQLEIRNIAKQIHDLVKPICPHSLDALFDKGA